MLIAHMFLIIVTLLFLVKVRYILFGVHLGASFQYFLGVCFGKPILTLIHRAVDRGTYLNNNSVT